MLDFFKAAFPWIVIGLAMAVFFATAPKRKAGNPSSDNTYTTEGMCIGMCIGVALSTCTDFLDLATGISLGMLVGMVIGVNLKKIK